MSDKTAEDYATVKVEGVLSRFDHLSPSIPHMAKLQQAIRLAILEALRDQRYACVEAVNSLGIPHGGMVVSVIQNATVQPSEPK
jgi:hypothetical protein